MLAFLLGFKWVKWAFDNWRLVLVGIAAAVVVGFFLYVHHLVEKTATLETQVSKLEDDLKTERETHKKVVTALEGKAKDAEDRSKFAIQSAEEIEADKKDGDGALAPVLARTLDRLHARQAQPSRNPR